MAKKLHPDVNKSPEAEERFKKIQQAYELLINDRSTSLTAMDRKGYTQPLQQDWVDMEKANIFYMLFSNTFADMFNKKK
jgi:DnaJ-class molecular chaperone